MCKYATVPDFLRYGEDMTKTAVNQKAIAVHGDLWREIKCIHNRMTFSQQQMISVFREVAACNGKSRWPRALTSTEADDVAQRMAKRFRVMARHLMQGLVKNRSWATFLMKATAENEGAKTTKAAPVAMKRPAAQDVEVAAPSFTYGYDHMTGKAYRQHGKKRSLADVLIGNKDEEHPVAIFDEDGEPIVIESVTNGELRERRRVALRSRGTIWQGEAADGEIISVRRISLAGSCRWSLPSGNFSWVQCRAG